MSKVQKLILIVYFIFITDGFSYLKNSDNEKIHLH